MTSHHLTSRDLVSVAANETCQRLIRLRLLGCSDQAAYRLLTNRDLPDERGERTAALRYGKVFDRNLVADQARALLEALQFITPLNTETVRVLDVEQAAKPNGVDAIQAALRMTTRALRDVAASRPTDDILLQPALRLALASWPPMIVRPDALVLNQASNTFWPLEAKAYPTIDGAIDPAERRSMRLQAAVQIAALREQTALINPHLPVSAEAILIVSSPFGLSPEPAILENLEAEVSLIDRAIAAVRREASSLAGRTPGLVAEFLEEAGWTFQESCLVGCGLARYCRAQQPGIDLALGDAVAAILSSLETVPGLPALLHEMARTRSPGVIDLKPVHDLIDRHGS